MLDHEQYFLFVYRVHKYESLMVFQHASTRRLIVHVKNMDVQDPITAYDHCLSLRLIYRHHKYQTNWEL